MVFFVQFHSLWKNEVIKGSYQKLYISVQENVYFCFDGASLNYFWNFESWVL